MNSVDSDFLAPRKSLVGDVMVVKVHDHTIKRSLVKYAIRFCTPSDEKACELHSVVRIGKV